MMKNKMRGTVAIRHPEFGARFTQALEANPNVPDYRHGCDVWVKEQLLTKHGVTVSGETVRKWREGITKPRSEAMQALAKILDVGEGWLSVGDGERGKSEFRNQVREVDGSVLAVAAFVQLAGNHIAFPEDGDLQAERDKVDIFALIKGHHYPFHVSTGQKVSGGYRFDVPPVYDGAFQIGVIHDDEFSLRFVEIPYDLVALGRVRGSHIEVEFNATDIGANQIKSFRERL